MAIFRPSIRRSIQTACLLGLSLACVLPARAEFFPDKGVAVSHWTEPKGGWGFEYSYWLNDHELVYVQPGPANQQQFARRNLTTGAEQVMKGFTNLVQGTTGNWPLPDLFPSPDGKYLAWIGTTNFYADTLVVATREGAIISRKPQKKALYYPGWSEDSQSCFAFLEGQVPEGDFPGDRMGFVAISAVNIKTPPVETNYPIATTPSGQQSALTGYTTRHHFTAKRHAWLSDFHFGRDGNMVLLSPIEKMSGSLSEVVWFKEFNIANTIGPVESHRILIPAPWEFVSAVISPTGDAIAWKLHHEDSAELWISDRTGGHLHRLGKFYEGELKAPTHVEHSFTEPYNIGWLPGGKGISFRAGRELYVVSPDAPINPH